ncbi:MAG TPA: VIT domain-containing protein [Bacteroidota bacterium]|nr:VIT domain-containing protein [Bacteroidota bacterium]
MKRLLVLAAVLLALSPIDADAGRMYARRPGTASPIFNLRQMSVHTQVRLRNLLAVTHVDELFENTEAELMEVWYVFQLPEGSTVDGLWLWLDGVRWKFIVKRKEVAQQMYDSLSQHQHADPAILESVGSNRFQLRLANMKPGEQRRIELEYFAELPVGADGTVRYVYPTNMSGYQSVPVAALQLNVDMRMDAPLLDVRTSADDRPLMVVRTPISDRHMQVHFGGEHILESDDFVLQYRLEGWSDSLFVITHWPAREDTGHFALWVNNRVEQQLTGAMDVVFAVDASGSMTGLRSDLVLRAIDTLLEALQPYDRFRLVFFSNVSQSFPADTSMLFANAVNIASARTALRVMYRARGTTSFSLAFDDLARTAFRDNCDRRCVLVTDALPNDGERALKPLSDMLLVHGTPVRLYPITTYAVPSPLLEHLAEASDGMYTMLEQGDNVFDVLRRVTFSFGSTSVRDVGITFPADVRASYTTSMLLDSGVVSSTASGLFLAEGEGNCVMQYRLAGTSQDIVRTRPLRLLADSTSPVEISRLWASRRIKDLLAQLREVTDSTEIREEIIRLSERYMVLSPFTAFIVYKADPPQMNSIGTLTMPDHCELRQNYPNPFNPSTSITFTLPMRVHAGETVLLRIYDLAGRLVRTLYHGPARPGSTTLPWDGRDDGGAVLPSGVYRCVLYWRGESRSISMTLLR